MNRLEIFEEVYSKDYVFTETELSRLQQVAELIVKECAEIVQEGRKWYKIFRNHYGQPKVVELDDDEDIHVL